jgi:hypothetical protein
MGSATSGLDKFSEALVWPTDLYGNIACRLGTVFCSATVKGQISGTPGDSDWAQQIQLVSDICEPIPF